jgi:hypothetical protein
MAHGKAEGRFTCRGMMTVSQPEKVDEAACFSKLRDNTNVFASAHLCDRSDPTISHPLKAALFQQEQEQL